MPHTTRSTFRFVLLTISALAVACSAPGEDASTRHNDLLVRSLAAAQQNADTMLIEEIFWPEATYDDYANQLQYRGLDEIVGYVTSPHTWGDDVYVNVGRVHASPTGAAAEWFFSAVQSRPMDAFVPEATGREVLLNGVTIIETEGERIIRAADYMDTAPLALQLGGRIELPGGTVIELDNGR